MTRPTPPGTGATPPGTGAKARLMIAMGLIKWQGQPNRIGCWAYYGVGALWLVPFGLWRSDRGTTHDTEAEALDALADL